MMTEMAGDIQEIAAMVEESERDVHYAKEHVDGGRNCDHIRNILSNK